MSASVQPPSDLELMQLADDELDEARTEELRRELSDDDRDKLAALALVGELLVERADDDDRADGLSDSIMAKIERDELPELEEGDSLELQRPDLPATTSGAPANDNARRIFVLAAMAAAVAAGLMVWGRTDPGPDLAARGRPPATAPAPTPSPAPAATGVDPSSAVAELDPVDNDAVPDDQPGVEVAAVDFGNPGGAVFYVEGAADEPKTTVVWVTDEVGDD